MAVRAVAAVSSVVTATGGGGWILKMKPFDGLMGFERDKMSNISIHVLIPINLTVTT